MRAVVNKPIERHPLRLALGKRYYILRRWAFWLFGGVKLAAVSGKIDGQRYFSHRTPLIRKLRDVDMYLQYNKIANLKIAVPKLDGATLRPGETFSYWRLIGEPTKRKGYRDGMVLHGGGFHAGTGGGLCQISNLIYWMTLHTPLTVVERHRHSYDVFPDSNRTQPFGSGATCFYNYGDLMIRNDTDRIFQLELHVGEHELSGAWVSDAPPSFTYEVYEKEHLIRPEYWGGYTRHNLLYRKKYDMDGTLLDDEYLVENHAIMMYSPFIAEKSISMQ